MASVKTPDLSEFDELEDLKRRKDRPPCSIASALDGLPEKDRLVVVEALKRDMETTSNATFVEWFARRGVKVHWQGVRSHRSGGCRCGSDG